MAKTKLSITVYPKKLEQAQDLLGPIAVSALLDTALSRLIRQEYERRHVQGYALHPPLDEDLLWADASRDASDIADDTDWACR